LRRVIAYDRLWYYDPDQRQTGPTGPLKLQQTSHFQRDPAASAVTANIDTDPGLKRPVRQSRRIT